MDDLAQFQDPNEIDTHSLQDLVESTNLDRGIDWQVRLQDAMTWA